MKESKIILDISNESKIANEIIDHLKSKRDLKDDLEGIILTIYETKLAKSSEHIIRVISDLISKDIIKESTQSNGKKYYSLIKS